MSITPTNGLYQANNVVTMLIANNQQAAMAHPMMPNSTMYFMDRSDPVLYARTTDNTGNTISFEIYDIVKREPAPAPRPATSGYTITTTKEELDNAVAEAVNRVLASMNKNNRSNNRQRNYHKKEENNG